jgi:hypothetical protein
LAPSNKIIGYTFFLTRISSHYISLLKRQQRRIIAEECRNLKRLFQSLPVKCGMRFFGSGLSYFALCRIPTLTPQLFMPLVCFGLGLSQVLPLDTGVRWTFLPLAENINFNLTN